MFKLFLCFFKMKVQTIYPLVNRHNDGKSPFFIGKSTINGHFQWLFWHNQRVPILQRLCHVLQIPSAAKEEQLPIIAPQSVITQMGDKVPRNGWSKRQPMRIDRWLMGCGLRMMRMFKYRYCVIVFHILFWMIFLNFKAGKRNGSWNDTMRLRGAAGMDSSDSSGRWAVAGHCSTRLGVVGYMMVHGLRGDQMHWDVRKVRHVYLLFLVSLSTYILWSYMFIHS